MRKRMIRAARPKYSAHRNPFAVHARRNTFWLCVLLLLSGVFACGSAPGVHAYERTGMLSYGGWELGPLRLGDGTFVYCLEPGTLTPQADFDQPTVATELRGYSVRTFDQTGWAGVVTTASVSGDPIQHMNYLLSTYGQTDNPKLRVALQLAVWQLRGDSGVQVWLNHHLTWVKDHGGSWEVDHAQQLVREATHARGESVAPVLPDLKFAWGQESEHGTYLDGTLEYPKGTRTLKITGASFLDGSTEQHVDPNTPGSLPWRHNSHLPMWSAQHDIRATGEAQQSVQQWPAQILMYPPNDRTQQVQGAGFGAAAEIVIVPYPEISLNRRDVFEPVLNTEVSKRVLHPAQDSFSDVVTVAAANAQRWPQRAGENGETEFLPLNLSGTLFGPFASPQVAAATAPDDANVVARKVLSVDSGPGSYRVVLPDHAVASGFYYWQWAIRESEQEEPVIRSGVIPKEYVYQDDFAEALEEHVVPMAFRVGTQLREAVLHATPLSIVDELDVSLISGRWIQDAQGQNVAVTLRLSVYQEDAQPVRDAEVPQHAKLISERRISGNSAHDFTDSGVIELPEETSGWVTVRACIVTADQPEAVQPYVIPGCDDYGIPAETARIQQQELVVSGSSIDAFGVQTFGRIGVVICLLGLGFLSVNLKRKYLFSFRSVETN